MLITAGLTEAHNLENLENVVTFPPFHLALVWFDRGYLILPQKLMRACNSKRKRNMNWKRGSVWFLVLPLSGQQLPHQWMAWGRTSCFLPGLPPRHHRAALNRLEIKLNKCTSLWKRPAETKLSRVTDLLIMSFEHDTTRTVSERHHKSEILTKHGH